MDYSALKSIIDTDYPLATDGEIIAALNSQTVDVPARAATKDMIMYLLLVRKWLIIKDSVTDIARQTVDALTIFETFDFSLPGVLDDYTTIVNDLETAELISAMDKAVLMSMTTRKTSRSAQELGREVNLRDINEARNYG